MIPNVVFRMKRKNKSVEALERMLGHLEHELPDNDVLVIRCKELIKEYSELSKKVK